MIEREANAINPNPVQSKTAAPSSPENEEAERKANSWAKSLLADGNWSHNHYDDAGMEAVVTKMFLSVLCSATELKPAHESESVHTPSPLGNEEAIKAVAREFLCDCEVCQRSAAICPGSASALIMEVASLRRDLAVGQQPAQKDDWQSRILRGEVINECIFCNGEKGRDEGIGWLTCPHCKGTGIEPAQPAQKQ